MNLTTAMETARSNLSVLSTKTAVVSRNISNASTPLASRKTVNTVTGIQGSGVRIASITRASDEALLRNLLAANSDGSRAQAMVDALKQLDQTIDDTEQDRSPAALIGKLADAIQQYSAMPGDIIRGQSAIEAANDVVDALHNATEIVQGVRTQADRDMATSVETINSLLARYKTVNDQIIQGTQFGTDITDYLDQRDSILNDLSKEIGIRTISRDNNDLAIFTDSGVTLFDGYARPVSYQPLQALTATLTGNAVYVDNVPVTGSGATLSVGSGRIKGLAEIRDETAVTYQNQLDEIARALIEAFAENDQSGSGLPYRTGLFGYSGSTLVPATGTLIQGLAGQITVSAAFDPSQSGDPSLLRDGGANGASYIYNTSGASGYSGRLSALLDGFRTTRSFDINAEIDTSATLEDFAAASVGWLEHARQTSANSLDYRNAVQQRASDSLSKATGVNLDYEMTILLDLEHSYQATTRLISTIDTLYQSLLQVGR